MESVELKKHSSLIAISNKNISVPQRKLYNAILYLAGKQLHSDPDNVKFKIRFTDIIKFSGYNDFSNKMYLKDCIRELVDTSIEFNLLGKDKQHTWGIFTLISQAIIQEYDEYITLEFPSMITENLSFPNIYALLNLSIVNSLSGKYSLPLYEFLTDYKGIRHITLEISKLRTIIGVHEDDYKRFSHFKSKVLTPGIAEINEKTDLTIDYILERSGRFYTHISFSIKEKYEKLSPVESSAFLLLKSKGMSQKTAAKFAQALNKETIVNSIEILENAIKKGSVKNSVAYLTKILANNIENEIETKIIFEKSKPLVPELDKNFENVIKTRIDSLITNVSDSDIAEFLSTQSQFSIDYLIGKNLLDINKNILNLAELIENPIFKSWIQKKYIDFELEKQQYEENLKQNPQKKSQ